MKATGSLIKIPQYILKWMSILTSLAVLNLSISCSYFKVQDVPMVSSEEVSNEINRLNATEKYVVIHSGAKFWSLRNMVVNEDNQTFSGEIGSISSEHLYKKSRDKKKSILYSKKKQKPLIEVHFYLKDNRTFEYNSKVDIPFDNVDKISFNEYDKTKSTVTSILTGVSIVGGVFLVAGLVALAMKSSCPFVYVKNDQGYAFTGELYPGTITPNMQHDDYLPLGAFKPNSDGVFEIKIANMLKEIDYTDYVHLMVLEADGADQILIDQEGKAHTISQLQTPQLVMQSGERVSSDPIMEKGDLKDFKFDGVGSSDSPSREMIFQFEKPADVTNGKLVLTVKNSPWLDYIYGKFNEKFGNYYNEFQKKQQNEPYDKIERWLNDQHIPLAVSVKTLNGWELVENLGTVGPLATRDLVVPIPLEGVSTNTVELKLETGFMFWELDYLAMDFSEDLPVKTKTIQPNKAITNYGENVTKLLGTQDEVYLKQENIGDEVQVFFNVENKSENQTFYLKSRGYYNYIRDYKGTPDFGELKRFREKEAFTKFSEEFYFQFLNYKSDIVQGHE